MSAQAIHELISVSAGKTPQAVAISGVTGKSINYLQLLDHIQSTTKILNEFGIGRNDPVAVVLPNGPQMAVAFLSIGSSASFAPLNPTYTTSEFDFYLSDLGAKALVV